MAARWRRPRMSQWMGFELIQNCYQSLLKGCYFSISLIRFSRSEVGLQLRLFECFQTDCFSICTQFGRGYPRPVHIGLETLLSEQASRALSLSQNSGCYKPPVCSATWITPQHGSSPSFLSCMAYLSSMWPVYYVLWCLHKVKSLLGWPSHPAPS